MRKFIPKALLNTVDEFVVLTIQGYFKDQHFLLSLRRLSLVYILESVFQEVVYQLPTGIFANSV